MAIYDGGSNTSSMLGKYCGDSIPSSHVSSSNEVLIQFKSDGSETRAGFKMEYHPTGNTSIQKNIEYYGDYYPTCATITCSWFEAALNYKLPILDPKIEEFPFLVHKLSVTLTAVCNNAWTVYRIVGVLFISRWFLFSYRINQNSH